MDAICIDMDNTIIDSDKTHIIAYQKAFKKNRLEVFSSKEIKKYFGLSSYNIVKNLFPKLNYFEIQKILTDNYNYFLKSKHKLKAFNGVKKTLLILKRKYILILISNCTRKEIVISLKEIKLNNKIFTLLVGSDDVKKPKPYPDEINFAKNKLKCNVKYLIGDSIYDIMAGRKAKVKTIGVLTGNHTKEELRKAKSDFIIDNFSEVLEIV